MRIALCAFTAALAWPLAAIAQQADDQPRWFKGNTHTHTLNSDGDSTPDEVVRWYRELRSRENPREQRADGVGPARDGAAGGRRRGVDDLVCGFAGGGALRSEGHLSTCQAPESRRAARDLRLGHLATFSPRPRVRLRSSARVDVFVARNAASHGVSRSRRDCGLSR